MDLDQFLLGMRVNLFGELFEKGLKMELNLAMHQVLTETITLEKEEQVKVMTAVPQAPAPVMVSNVELVKTFLDEVVRQLKETQTTREERLACRAQNSRQT